MASLTKTSVSRCRDWARPSVDRRIALASLKEIQEATHNTTESEITAMVSPKINASLTSTYLPPSNPSIDHTDEHFASEVPILTALSVWNLPLQDSGGLRSGSVPACTKRVLFPLGGPHYPSPHPRNCEPLAVLVDRRYTRYQVGEGT